MNAREATQAKLQQLLNRAPPLPGRGIIINNEDNYTPISLNSHIDMYKYVMDHDEKSSQRLVDQFKILKPPPKLISPKAEIIYARKSRCNSPSILTRRIEKNTMHSTPIQKTSPWKGQSRSFKKSNQDDEGDDQGVINDTRPASASKVSGLSWHLQLDQERFVERRKSFDIAEKISKEKQEAYEAYLNQRLQKASKGSNDAFLDLVKRNEEWRQQCRNRRKQAKEKYAEEWINRRKEFRDKLAEHINKPLPKIDRSWREIEDEQELQRLERVERRMNELRISSASPLVSRPNSNGTFVVDRVGGIGSMRVYRSTSRPVSRSRNRVASESVPPQICGKKPKITPLEFLEGIQRRTQEFDQRRQFRIEQQAIRESQEALEKERIEQDRNIRLMRSRMPVGYDRSTKAVDDRERAIKEKIQRRQEIERRQFKRQQKQKQSEKAISIMLKKIILENEADRKTRHGGYIELSHTDNRAVNNIKLDRDSYLESFRASKKQIERSLENRPTLLHRHNESIARKAAIQEAEEKIAALTRGISQSQVYSPSSNTSKSTRLQPLSRRTHRVERHVRDGLDKTFGSGSGHSVGDTDDDIKFVLARQSFNSNHSGDRSIRSVTFQDIYDEGYDRDIDMAGAKQSSKVNLSSFESK